MIARIYIAGVVSMALIILLCVPSLGANTRMEKASHLLLVVACIAFWPLFLIWVVYEFISLWLWEIDDSESES